MMSGSSDVGTAIQPSMAARSRWPAGGMVTRPRCAARAVRAATMASMAWSDRRQTLSNSLSLSQGRDGQDRVDQLPQFGYVGCPLVPPVGEIPPLEQGCRVDLH